MIGRALAVALLCSIIQVRGQSGVPTISDNIADRDQAGRDLVKRVRSMAPAENFHWKRNMM